MVNLVVPFYLLGSRDLSYHLLILVVGVAPACTYLPERGRGGEGRDSQIGEVFVGYDVQNFNLNVPPLDLVSLGENAG